MEGGRDQVVRRPLSLKPAYSQPLWEAVYRTLREAIVLGDLPPGERLAEQKLAEALGTSRTPVREALRRLALEGFVVLVPRRGAYVASVSLKDMHDIFELRMALEGLAASLAARRITKEEIAVLDSSVLAFKAAAEASDANQAIGVDSYFHTTIYTASRNRRLIQILGNLSDQIQGLRMRSLSAPDRLKDSLNEHRRLVAAIASGDSVAARNAAEEHIMLAEASLLQDQHPSIGCSGRGESGGRCSGFGGSGKHQETSSGEPGTL